MEVVGCDWWDAWTCSDPLRTWSTPGKKNGLVHSRSLRFADLHRGGRSAIGGGVGAVICSDNVLIVPLACKHTPRYATNGLPKGETGSGQIYSCHAIDEV